MVVDARKHAEFYVVGCSAMAAQRWKDLFFFFLHVTDGRCWGIEVFSRNCCPPTCSVFGRVLSLAVVTKVSRNINSVTHGINQHQGNRAVPSSETNAQNNLMDV